MLESRIILEIGIRHKTNCRVLAEIVLVDEWIVVRNLADVGALPALESGRLAFLECVETVLAIGAEIHPVCPYIPIPDWNSFFPTQFGAFKTG